MKIRPALRQPWTPPLCLTLAWLSPARPAAAQDVGSRVLQPALLLCPWAGSNDLVVTVDDLSGARVTDLFIICSAQSLVRLDGEGLSYVDRK